MVARIFGSRVRSRTLGTAASIAALTFSLVACSSAPERIRVKSPNPLVPIEGEWERTTPPGPGVALPPGWTPGNTETLCFEARGNTYCLNVCIAYSSSDPNCIYVKHGDCEPGSGWIKYCPRVVAQEALPSPSPLAGCESKTASVQYDVTSGDTKVQYQVACTTWVDDDLVMTTIAHPSNPGVHLDSNTFRAIYGDWMPAKSVVSFAGTPDVVAWNTLLLKVESVQFDTTLGHKVDSVILNPSGQNYPQFAVTVINGAIADVRGIYVP